MKYIKKYEHFSEKSGINTKDDIVVGGYVICIDDNLYGGDIELVIGEKYRVMELYGIHIKVKDKHDNVETFLKGRFISELEYNANKYNL